MIVIVNEARLQPTRQCDLGVTLPLSATLQLPRLRSMLHEIISFIITQHLILVYSDRTQVDGEKE